MGEEKNPKNHQNIQRTEQKNHINELQPPNDKQYSIDVSHNYQGFPWGT